MILPDKGYRYQETIYDNQWLKENDLWIDELPTAPELVDSPIAAQQKGGWNRFLWNNRTYKEIIGEEV